MKHNNTSIWEKLPFFSRKWVLSAEEKDLLGEEHEREYHQKVKEYCSKRASMTLHFAETAGIIALCPAIAISCVISHFLHNQVLTSMNSLIIGVAVLSTIMITAAALVGALISSKLEVKDAQNPKDWKDIVLDQKASKEESPLKKDSSIKDKSTLENNDLKIIF